MIFSRQNKKKNEIPHIKNPRGKWIYGISVLRFELPSFSKWTRPEAIKIPEENKLQYKSK